MTFCRDAALMLLDEISKGGVVDTTHQALCLHLMALCPEDVCKIRFGSMSENAIEACRIIRDAYGVVFKIRVDKTIIDKKMKKVGGGKGNDRIEGAKGEEVEEISGMEEGGGDDFDESKVGILASTLTDTADADADTAAGAGAGAGGGSSLSPFDPSSRKFTDESGTLLISCLGSGFVNMSRKIR